jgi:hypothetical protein
MIVRGLGAWGKWYLLNVQVYTFQTQSNNSTRYLGVVKADTCCSTNAVNAKQR